MAAPLPGTQPLGRSAASHRALTFPGMRTPRSFALILSLTTSIAGCRSLPGLAPSVSPREAYLRSLEAAQLTSRQLAVEWIAAARHALIAPTAISASYRETGYFDPSRPSAAGFALEAGPGELIQARLTTAPSDAPVFLELLRPSAEDWEVVASGSDGRALDYQPRRAERLVLLVQPELLAGGRYTLDVVIGGSLSFPVAEVPGRRIISGFGAPRDGGARSHQGIDIGAPRGTAALAADDGWILSANENELGGRVIWMRGDSGVTLYYAHLDRQLVQGGERVARGDTIGEVGDTGNARGTTPHLHFEVRSGEAHFDPGPWIRQAPAPQAVTANLELVGAWARAARDGTRLRERPAAQSPPAGELSRDQAARVTAASRDWYRVELPDGRRGYAAAAHLVATRSAVRRIPLHQPLELRAGPEPSAPPIARLEAGQSADVLAVSGETVLIGGPTGARGWSEIP